MRVAFVSLLFIILSFVRAEGEEYRGLIKLVEKSSQWQEGEIKQVVIQVYPLQDVSVEDIRKKLESSDFCDFFYIGKIESIDFSKNNPVVLEIKADMTLKKIYNPSRPLIWSYLALNIPISLEGVELIAQEGKIQEYITLDVKRNIKSNEWWIWLSVIFLVGISVLIIFLRKQKKKNIKSSLQEVKMLLVKATTRKDFEQIYRSRKKIEDIFGESNPAFTNLFNIINKHQFKKDINEDELYEINFVLDEIKESLRNG